MALVLVLIYGGAAALAISWHAAPAARYRGLDPNAIPAKMAPYDVSQDYDVGPTVRAMLSTGDIVAKRYGSGADAIDFVLIGGQDRNSMHDPRLCLTGSGDKLSNDRVVHLPGTDVDARAYQATSKDNVTYDVLYFYVTDGRIDNEYARVRRSMLWCDLTGQRKPPIYFLRFTQRVAADPSTASTDFKRMTALAAGIWKAIRPRLSSG